MTNEELEPIASDVRALLDRERVVPEVPGGVSAQLHARVAETLGVSLGAGSTAMGVTTDVTARAISGAPAGAAAGATALATWTFAKLAPIALAFAVGGATGVVATLAVVRAPETSAVRAPEPIAAQPAEPTLRALEPVPVPIEKAGPGGEPPAQPAAAGASEQSTARVEARMPSDRELREERELLELARTALGRGQAEDALDGLRRHTRRFPKGRLAEERDSLRVLALAMLGKDDEARAAAAAFQKRYPSSLFAPVVQRAIEAP